MTSESENELAADSNAEARWGRREFLAASGAGALLAAGSSPLLAAEEPPAAAGLAAKLRGASVIVVGKIINRKDGPTGLSFPPLFNLSFQIAESEKLRGKWAEATIASYTIRQENSPQFDPEKKYVVALRGPDGGKGNWKVLAIELADEGNLAVARKLAPLPLGWDLQGGKIVSPWQARGAGYWPQESTPAAEAKCSVSGRPAFAAGEIALAAEQVLPANRHEFRNPFGDGEFQITVSNPSDKPIAVPALLQEGNKILWEESLVIFAGRNPAVLPGQAKLPAGLSPTMLGPKEKITGKIDTLGLPGVAWPRGGSRVYFTFALGEQAAENFFYYFSNLHDAMRAKRAPQQ